MSSLLPLNIVFLISYTRWGFITTPLEGRLPTGLTSIYPLSLLYPAQTRYKTKKRVNLTEGDLRFLKQVSTWQVTNCRTRVSCSLGREGDQGTWDSWNRVYWTLQFKHIHNKEYTEVGV